MAFKSNAILTRREVMRRISGLALKKELVEKIDRIVLTMRPRSNVPLRCCVYKDRAVLQYKMMPVLGIAVEEEIDELMRPKDYARVALQRQEPVKGALLSVVGEACSSCPQTNYLVTNVCQGCEGRFCVLNCPKKAIEMVDGYARIKSEDCINCGLCKKACPFHAIVYIPVPCIETCPVEAIGKDELGRAVIDYSKCILCGRCIQACPYGAINERSHLLDIIRSIQSKEETIALAAPSLAGQFRATYPQLKTALLRLGFNGVEEVAIGAEETIEHETAEWVERIEKGAKFMTTSCCASWMNLVEKIEEVKPYVSETPTPLDYTVIRMRREHPKARLVFISPCVAKKAEAVKHRSADLVLSVEELGTLFIAAGVEVSQSESNESGVKASSGAWGFATSGGVASAIAAKGVDGFNPVRINGISASTIKQIQQTAKRGECDYNFIEVMVCEGGCVNGCNTLNSATAASTQMVKELGIPGLKCGIPEWETAKK